MVSALLIGGIIVGIAAVGGAAFAIAMLIRRRKELEAIAEQGSSAEKSLESEVGLADTANAELKIETAEGTTRQKELLYESAELSEEGKVKGYKDALKAVRAVEAGAQASEHEEAAEKTTAAIEGRGIGIEAATKKILMAVIEYTSKKRNNILNERQEAIVLDGMAKKINKTANLNVIDSSMNLYLREFFKSLASAFRLDMDIEQKKGELLEKLVNEMENAIGVMKTSISGARTEVGKLRNEERKTRKNFRRELKDFEASLNVKSRQIDEMGKRKDTNPVLTVNLIKERDMRWKQLRGAKSLNGQLEDTYAFIKKDMKKIRRLLNNVLSGEKNIKKYEGTLSNRKRQIDKRFEALKKASNEIEKIAEKEIDNPRKTILEISSDIMSYFKAYGKILEDDLSFDCTVKEIVTKNLEVSHQMEAFQQLANGLTQSEKNIEYGIGALTKLLSEIAPETSQENIAHVVQTLKQSAKILNYEQGIEAFMKSLAQNIKNKSLQLGTTIQLIIDEDKKLLAQIKAEEESNSSHLGNMIAVAMRRMINLDKKYAEQSNAFANQLRQSNSIAAASYRRSIKAA